MFRTKLLALLELHVAHNFLISIFCCVHYLKIDQQLKCPKICITIAVLSLILCGVFSNAHNTSNVDSDTDSSLVADSDSDDESTDDDEDDESAADLESERQASESLARAESESRAQAESESRAYEESVATAQT